MIFFHFPIMNTKNIPKNMIELSKALFRILIICQSVEAFHDFIGVLNFFPIFHLNNGCIDAVVWLQSERCCVNTHLTANFSITMFYSSFNLLLLWMEMKRLKATMNSCCVKFNLTSLLWMVFFFPLRICFLCSVWFYHLIYLTSSRGIKIRHFIRWCELIRAIC